MVENEILNYNDNAIDEWNDTISVFDNNKFTLHVPGTVDPGLYYSKNPMNPRGTARIEPGLHLLRPGKHRGKDAFVQYAKISVRRDSNRDMIWSQEDPVDTGWFGIHLHASGNIRNVGRDSAGCVVPRLLWNDPVWRNEFVGRGKRSGQSRILLAIVDPQDLARWIGEQRWWG